MPPGTKRCALRRVFDVGFVIVALVAAVTGLATTSHAQSAGTARVKIDFGFVAGGKDMPAGEYEFSVTEGRVVMRPRAGGAVVTMTVITRLGRHDADPDPELVFDKINGKSILSEFWLPGADGYLLEHASADHEHRVVGGSRPHK